MDLITLLGSAMFAKYVIRLQPVGATHYIIWNDPDNNQCYAYQANKVMTLFPIDPVPIATKYKTFDKLLNSNPNATIIDLSALAADLEARENNNGLDPTVASIDQTLNQRGKRYGDYKYRAGIARNIRNSFEHAIGWNDLSVEQKHSLELIADKISRILCGDCNHIDNWHDIQGYARLIEIELKRENSSSDYAFSSPFVTPESVVNDTKAGQS